MFRRPESEPRCGRAELPPEAPGEGPSCPLQLLGLQVSFGFWIHHPNLCLRVHMDTLFLNFPLLIRTQSYWIRAPNIPV